MKNVFRKKLVVAAALTIVAGVAVFGVSMAGAAKPPSPPPAPKPAASQQGAIGGDFDRAPGSNPDFGVIQQLQSPARAALDDAHVIVVASQCSATDPVTPGTCAGQSSDEDTTLCPSTWANGQLPNNPTAAKGYVCVYVLGGDNFGTVAGTGAIHGSSIAPGTLGSALGFKIGWDPDNTGDTYVDAVWAYR